MAQPEEAGFGKAIGNLMKTVCNRPDKLFMTCYTEREKMVNINSFPRHAVGTLHPEHAEELLTQSITWHWES